MALDHLLEHLSIYIRMLGVCVCVCLILRAQIKHQMADLFLNALRKIRQLDKKQMKYERTHLKCCCFSFMCVNVKH